MGMFQITLVTCFFFCLLDSHRFLLTDLPFMALISNAQSMPVGPLPLSLPVPSILPTLLPSFSLLFSFLPFPSFFLPSFLQSFFLQMFVEILLCVRQYCIIIWDTWVVEHLPSAQVIWDQVPHRAPCKGPASPSAYVSACVSE